MATNDDNSTSMYGTVMIGKVKPGHLEAAREAARRWFAEREPHITGFVDEWMMLADDGVTIINPVRFASREAYEQLGADPEQARFYEEEFAPHLDGEVQWFDGTWIPWPGEAP